MRARKNEFQRRGTHDLPEAASFTERRFWRFTVITEHGAEWRGPMQGDYGRFSAMGIPTYAHRYAWSLLRGPIPDGYTLDHEKTCPKTCVTPGHMTPRTNREHTTIGWARGEYDNSWINRRKRKAAQ